MSGYKPMRAYEYDFETHQILGRFLFQIGGEWANGMKTWYKVGEDGELDYSRLYSMTRANGKMIAILEAVD